MNNARQAIVSKAAADVIRKLTFAQQQQVYRVILNLRKNPFPVGAEKVPEAASSFRLVVGEFRILYEVEATIVRIEAIRSTL